MDAPRKAITREVATLLMLALSSWGSAASAQTAEEAARTHFAAGNLAFEDARWLDCAHDFERSFAIVFAPELLYNVGLCYQRAAGALGDAEARPLLERALGAFRRYLREIPDAEDAVRVRAAIADLEARLDPIFELPVVEETAGSTPSAPELTPDATPRPDPGVSRAEPEPPMAVSSPSYAFTIAGGALAVVSLAIAIGLGAHAQNVYSRLASTCGGTSIGCTDAQISEVATLSTAANVMYVAAGGMLAWTAIAFGLEFASNDAAPTMATVSLSGRF